MSKVVTMRIRFPQTYPVIYKTLRVDGELSVKAAIEFIAEALHMPPEDNIGLYLPSAKKWLDNDTPLVNFQDEISEEVCFLFLFFCDSATTDTNVMCAPKRDART